MAEQFVWVWMEPRNPISVRLRVTLNSLGIGYGKVGREFDSPSATTEEKENNALRNKRSKAPADQRNTRQWPSVR